LPANKISLSLLEQNYRAEGESSTFPIEPAAISPSAVRDMTFHFLLHAPCASDWTSIPSILDGYLRAVVSSSLADLSLRKI